MRDPKRIKRICREIEKSWKQNSDLRLGQLLSNIPKDLYYIEDEELMYLLKQMYK